MTPSPELIHELRASRPSAPGELRARVRAIAAERPADRSLFAGWRIPVRRGALVAVPAAAALAFASAGVLGLALSDTRARVNAENAPTPTLEASTAAPETLAPSTDQAQGAGTRATGDRAQKVSATLTVEVKDAEAVSRAAQGAIDLTRSLGGFVVSSSVTTGEEGGAAITVRVPVDKVQDAIAGLSGLGRIVSQQVTVEDRQESIDAAQQRSRSLRAQIALVSARLESGTLDAATEARLEARLKSLKVELLATRRALGSLRAESRMSTIQLTVVTPGALGVVAPPSRIDRAIDEAVNVLAWEAVVGLGIVIVLAPFALVGFAALLGRRLYRRHEEERLLAT